MISWISDMISFDLHLPNKAKIFFGYHTFVIALNKSSNQYYLILFYFFILLSAKILLVARDCAHGLLCHLNFQGLYFPGSQTVQQLKPQTDFQTKD